MSAFLRLFAVLGALLFGAAAYAQESGELPDMVLGKADAPITIIEYASLTCSHCASFHRETLPKLKAEWIETGKAKLVYRDFPFDGWALGAAMIARCAGPDRYFAFLDTLFRSQEQWAQSKNPLEGLRSIARLGGMTDQQFNTCIGDQKLMGAIQARRMEAEKKLGINSTPTFFINGEKIAGAQPYAEFEKVLKAAAK